MKKIIALLAALALTLTFAAVADEEVTDEEVTDVELTDEAITGWYGEQVAILGSRENPVPVGQKYVLQTEINADGTARKEATEADYSTITLSIALKNVLEPDYYAEKYSTTYRLKGTEACAVLEIGLDETTGVETIVPQGAILVRLADENGDFITGYQMMDSEIGGINGVAVQLGSATRLYKRYDFDANRLMKYVVVTSYQNGVEKETYFLLEKPFVYPTLQKGDHSDDVQKLQQKLYDDGYLSGGVDGIYGSGTEAAVKAAQAAAGLEQTGIADSELQHFLYD